ncbi:MAG: hypothetical protein V3V49_07085 [Candidatus Krumholzibacteria bacterium]
MRNRILSGLLAVVVLFGAISCGDDDPVSPLPVPSPELIPQKDDVLNLLRKAYNERNIQQYDRLLDDSLTFFFSPEDVTSGNVPLAKWDRASELLATGHMFDPTFDPAPHTNPDGSITNPGPISRISLTMEYPAGDEAWNPQIDEDVHPGEMWYEKTVNYKLDVTAGDFTFRNAAWLQASFVIRFAEVNGDSMYRLVSWRDDL